MLLFPYIDKHKLCNCVRLLLAELHLLVTTADRTYYITRGKFTRCVASPFLYGIVIGIGMLFI